ncbi:MAG: curli production assembly/transport protein CsgE [Burkholderiaceae bacterium]
MRFSMIWLISLAAAAFSPLARGQHPGLTQDTLPRTVLDEGQKKKSVFDDPLGGVVTNRTVTVLGNDFYQDFTALWRQKDISNQFSLSIYERPSARFGSEIWIQFRQKRMFHAFLPPARARTKQISAAAVELVYQGIANSEAERILVRSPDLGPEEM